MATDKEYLTEVLALLESADGIRFRPMMGEFLLYRNDTLFGGVYDNRFLIKDTAAGRALLPDAVPELPYEGAKPMLPVDLCDPTAVAELVNATAEALKKPKKKGE